MSARKSIVWCVLLSALAAATGCHRAARPDSSLSGSAGGIEPLGPQEPAYQQEYLVGPGDILRITIYGHDELARELEVDPDGNISFPFVGLVSVSGLTPVQIQQRLASALGPDYLMNPQVTVNVKEFKSKRFYIQGEVQEPGSYPLLKDMTALQAVIIAKGFTKFANTRTLKIIRETPYGYTEIKVRLSSILEGTEPKSSMILQPNDTVVVTKSLF
jgi:polysaccharide export outer membrane protein